MESLRPGLLADPQNQSSTRLQRVTEIRNGNNNNSSINTDGSLGANNSPVLLKSDIDAAFSIIGEKGQPPNSTNR